MSQSPNSLFLYIAENTRFVPKTEELSAVNQNRARKTLILHQPIRIEHEKTLQRSQSESCITLLESSANQNRVSRLPIALG